jgi:hypothetical protein
MYEANLLNLHDNLDTVGISGKAAECEVVIRLVV